MRPRECKFTGRGILRKFVRAGVRHLAFSIHDSGSDNWLDASAVHHCMQASYVSVSGACLVLQRLSEDVLKPYNCQDRRSSYGLMYGFEEIYGAVEWIVVDRWLKKLMNHAICAHEYERKCVQVSFAFSCLMNWLRCKARHLVWMITAMRRDK